MLDYSDLLSTPSVEMNMIWELLIKKTLLKREKKLQYKLK